MTPTESEILAQMPGPLLDMTVHKVVCGLGGKVAPAYSTDDHLALGLLDRLPLFVASIDPGRKGYNPDKPFVAGRLQHDQASQGDLTLFRVVAATKAIALCKAALLVVAKSANGVKAAAANGVPTMEERIGAQVAKRRAEKQDGAKAKQTRRPQKLPTTFPQPSARVSERGGREPLPPRKPFVPGAVLVAPPISGQP